MGKFEEFLEREYLINESLDTFYKIEKTEKKSDIEYNYFTINEKQYRMFSENLDNHFHIGFERYKEYDNIWDIYGLTRDLSNKEVLGLFGTIKKYILSQKFKSINVSTYEVNKLSLYIRMMKKLCNELNNNGYDFKFGNNDDFIFIYSDETYNKNIFKEFKYKTKAR